MYIFSVCDHNLTSWIEQEKSGSSAGGIVAGILVVIFLLGGVGAAL